MAALDPGLALRHEPPSEGGECEGEPSSNRAINSFFAAWEVNVHDARPHGTPCDCTRQDERVKCWDFVSSCHLTWAFAYGFRTLEPGPQALRTNAYAVYAWEYLPCSLFWVTSEALISTCACDWSHSAGLVISRRTGHHPSRVSRSPSQASRPASFYSSVFTTPE